MSDAYTADCREPSQDYIKAMMYVVEEYTTSLTQQEIYDITHTLIMSGFYTGIERSLLTGHVSPENASGVPRGTLNSYPPREPVLKTESQYELEIGAAHCQKCNSVTVADCDDLGCGFLGAGNGSPESELGYAVSGPFSEALEKAQEEAQTSPENHQNKYGSDDCTCDQCIQLDWE